MDASARATHGKVVNALSGHRRYAFPDRTLPARPALWIALACDTGITCTRKPHKMSLFLGEHLSCM